jgi:hypothetical protein
LHEPSPEDTESRARANGVGTLFDPSFQEIIDWCREKRDNPDDDTDTAVRVGRLQLDAIHKAIEHKRLENETGANISYVVEVVQPSPPVVPEGVEVEDGETVH